MTDTSNLAAEGDALVGDIKANLDALAAQQVADEKRISALESAVAALQPAPAPTPTPPPAPTPTPTPTQPVYLFDGRAVTQGPLPVVSGTGSNVSNNPPNPYGVWTGSNPLNGGYTYMGTDLSTITDPTGRWTKVFRAAPKAGDHNPYDPSPTPGTTSGQMSKARPTGLGTTLWFANSFLIPSPFTFPDWGTLDSYGYLTVRFDQCAIGVGASPPSGGAKNAWTISINSGLYTASNDSVTTSILYGFKPVTLDQWADIIVGVGVAADTTGFVEVHYRPGASGSWSQAYTKTGIPTVEWTNTTGTPQVKSSVLDKTGLYFGNWSGANPGPTGTVLSRGTSRHPSLQDALAALS